MEKSESGIIPFNRIISQGQAIAPPCKEDYQTELQQVTISASIAGKFSATENASCIIIGIADNDEKTTIAILNKYTMQHVVSLDLSSYKSIKTEWLNFSDGAVEIRGVHVLDDYEEDEAEIEKEIMGIAQAAEPSKKAKVVEIPKAKSSSSSSSSDSSSSSSDSGSSSSSDDSSSDSSDSSDDDSNSDSSDDSSSDEKKQKPGNKKIKPVPKHKEHSGKKFGRDNDRRGDDRRGGDRRGDDRRGGDRRGDDRRGGDRRGDDRRGGDRRGDDRRGGDRRGDDRRGGDRRGNDRRGDDRRGGDRGGFRSFNRDNNGGGKMNCYNCSFVASDKTDLLKHKKSAHPFK